MGHATFLDFSRALSRTGVLEHPTWGRVVNGSLIHALNQFHVCCQKQNALQPARFSRLLWREVLVMSWTGGFSFAARALGGFGGRNVNHLRNYNREGLPK